MRNTKVFIISVLLIFAWLVPAYSSEVDDINAAIESRGAHWKAGETSMTALTPEERAMRLGILAKPLPREQRKSITAAPAASLPAALDWRNNNGNWVTGVRNQGGCGSCWDFASTAGLESYTLIARNTPGYDLNLSEQVVLSCSGYGSCNGGYLVDQFFVTTGVPVETCYPYTGTDGSCSNACSNWTSNAYKVSGYTWVVPYGAQQTVDILRNALNSYGPVVVTMAVYSDFYSYTSGIYAHVSGGLAGYHAILLVGYDDTNSCFIVKNSWGAGWGENGFFRIAYSELTDAVDFGYEALAYGNPQAKLNLSISPAGSGSVTANPPSATGYYNKGASVQLTAAPTACSDFLSWSGDASGSSNPVTITMDSDKTVTANFSIKRHYLTTGVNNPAGGTVTAGGYYDCGSYTQVTATPNPGYIFSGWSGDITGANNPLTVTMDTDKTITANFKRQGIQLNIISQNGASVSFTSQMYYNDNPVSGKTMTFYEQTGTGSYISKGTATTNSSGIAAKTFNSAIGEHNLIVKFAASGGMPSMQSDNVTYTIGKAILASPSNGEVVKTATPTLSWQAYGGAGSYHVQIAASGTFSPRSLIMDNDVAGASIAAPSLIAGKTYYWRVFAYIPNGETMYSDKWKLIYKVGTNLNLEFITLNGATVTLKAFLTTEDGTPVPGRYLRFYENTDGGPFTSRGTATTGSATSANPGMVTKSWSTAVGAHNACVVFKGSSIYAPVATDPSDVAYIRAE